MVEPTESEAKDELDRFCDAMIAIRGEIQAVDRRKSGRQGQRAQERAAYGRRYRQPSGRIRTRVSRPSFRSRSSGSGSSGRASAASTTPTATAISSARARRFLTRRSLFAAIRIDHVEIGIDHDRAHRFTGARLEHVDDVGEVIACEAFLDRRRDDTVVARRDVRAQLVVLRERMFLLAVVA